MITFAESFLYIDMIDGVKQYCPASGATLTLKVFNLTVTKANVSETYASGQSSVPISTLLGRSPEILRISGPLCKINTYSSVLATIGSNHYVNTLYNTFLVGSILTITSSISPEANGEWIVSEFTIRRTSQRRNLITYDLTLKKWYIDLPSM
jgi:hypothetical protein